MSTANIKPNPFHVLGLPVDADQRTIVEQAEEGMQTAASAQERELYDWAMRELIKHPHTRLLHELTEPRPTAYRDRRREAFVRRNRANPAKLPAKRLAPDDFDLPEAVRRMVRELIETTPTGGLATLPVTSGDTEPELEVRDVLF